ncbi:E3 ubiquitin-protein ligase RNF166-like [Haliotis asinina]|uniref:E3 ubiquitin-protein ligase RNF166-like n=1 Tax=Haliotis asinina TaxID=109174 RepID=UPI00353246A5
MAQCSSDADASFKCPVCLELLQSPVRIGCPFQHVYCQCCAIGLQNVHPPTCPQCRSPFDPSQMEKALDIENNMRTNRANCQWCGQQMAVYNLRDHMEKCTSADHSIPQFRPVRQTSQPVPSNIPNRSTFQCPYCEEKNLESLALVKHCNEQHRHCPQQVVCPVCASMPWGDKSRVSANFLQHLNLRHKFEYDTYVDYEHDDESMLQEAIQASLQSF